MLDHKTETVSPELAPCLSVTVVEVRTAWDARLGEGVLESRLYAVSPASAKNYAGLAPVYLDVGELDLFRRESIDWVEKASTAAVQVESHLYPGVKHGFELIALDSDMVRQAFGLRARAIRRMVDL